ncbi:MAG: hypothetical protein JXN59_08180 [Anaerolineae bacterium]|nr:hypothetical protein [Anaerolineae bacterium]
MAHTTPEAFAKAVAWLRDHPARRHAMGQAAHPWKAIMAQLEGYYARAIALNRRWQRRYHHQADGQWEAFWDNMRL